MLRTHGLAMVLALTLALAASTAILPTVPLKEMAPDHACFFICEICLEGQSEANLMGCANDICGRINSENTCGPVLDLSMLWLGHKCKDNFGLVMDLWDRTPGPTVVSAAAKKRSS